MLRVHPQHLLGAQERYLLRVWQGFRRGGGGGLVLPRDMAAMPAYLVAAFDVMDEQAARVERALRDIDQSNRLGGRR